MVCPPRYKTSQSRWRGRAIYEVGKRLVKLSVDANLVTENPGNLLNYEVIDGIKTYRIKENIKAYLYVKK